MRPNTDTTAGEMVEDAEVDDEKLLILPLNDTNSKKISQLIASDTARDILDVIASAPRSASEIANHLEIPLTTVQYNLEKLFDAGLVKVERTRYSKKMKPVKLYAPRRKFVVIAPETTDREDVIATLKRYLMVMVFALVGSGAIEFLTMRMGGFAEDTAIKSLPEEAPAPPLAPMYAPSPTPLPREALNAVPGFDFFAHPGLWFFFGCLFVLLVILLIEYRSRKKKGDS